MALLFMDSFDHYATADIAAHWTTVGLSGASGSAGTIAAVGRHTSSAFRFLFNANIGGGSTMYANKVLSAPAPTGSTMIIGFSLGVAGTLQYVSSLPIVWCMDGGTVQWDLRLLSDLRLQLTRNGTVLVTSVAPVVAVGGVVQIQAKVLIDPSVGTCEVRINGGTTPFMSGTNLNTRNSTVNTFTGFQIGASQGTTPGITLDFDDMWVCDGSGEAPWNDFLGDCRVDSRFGTGAGAVTGWTPSTGANWSCVDEVTENGDTDYVQSATLGLEDTYVVQDVALPGSVVLGVQVLTYAKKADAGPSGVAPVVRHSGVSTPGTSRALSTAYAYYSQLYPKNPGTNAPWTESEFNAAEFGVRHV